MHPLLLTAIFSLRNKHVIYVNNEIYMRQCFSGVHHNKNYLIHYPFYVIDPRVITVASRSGGDKSYYTEFIIMTILFVLVLILLTVVLLKITQSRH